MHTEYSNHHTDACKHHSHSCGHSHTHSHKNLSTRRMLFVTLLNLLITVAEIIGGLLSNSLSLLSDAVHNLGDTLSIVFAYIAKVIGNKKANVSYTFGYRRAEVLAAFVNASLLISICLFLLKEAYDRFLNPEVIESKLVIVVAIIGLIANLVSMYLLHKDKDKSINIKAAYLHMLGDTFSSVAVVVGAFAIWRYNIFWLDPLITVFVSLYIIYHTWGVLKESVDIIMQKTPNGIDINNIVKEISQVEGVNSVHHVHMWQLIERQIHFEAHISLNEDVEMCRLKQIKQQTQEILSNHGVYHSTLQMDLDCCRGNAGLIVEENID